MVVAYTMVVLIAIYTFQFEDFPGYWGNFTGFTEQQYVPWFRVYYLYVFQRIYKKKDLNIIPNPTQKEKYIWMFLLLFSTQLK